MAASLVTRFLQALHSHFWAIRLPAESSRSPNSVPMGGMNSSTSPRSWTTLLKPMNSLLRSFLTIALGKPVVNLRVLLNKGLPLCDAESGVPVELG